MSLNMLSILSKQFPGNDRSVYPSDQRANVGNQLRKSDALEVLTTDCRITAMFASCRRCHGYRCRRMGCRCSGNGSGESHRCSANRLRLGCDTCESSYRRGFGKRLDCDSRSRTRPETLSVLNSFEARKFRHGLRAASTAAKQPDESGSAVAA